MAKRVSYKVDLDSSDAKRAIQDLSKYMSDELGKAAAKAIQDALKSAGSGGGSGIGGGGNSGSLAYYMRRNNADSPLNNPRGKYKATTAASTSSGSSIDTTSINRELKSVAGNIRSLNSMINQQQRIYNKAASTRTMTYTQNANFNSNQQSLNDKNGVYRQVATGYGRQIKQLQSANEGLKVQSTMGTPAQQNAAKEQLAYNDKLITSYKDYIETLKTAKQSMKDLTDSMNREQNSATSSTGSAINVDPQRGSLAYNLQQRAFAFGARTTGGVTDGITSIYQAGKSINQSTGQQALQLGNLVGGRTDQQTREDVQSYAGKYGYNTQQGLDFYQNAIAQRGSVLSASEAKSRVGAIEANGRASGLSDNSYSSLMGVASNAGAINSNSDVKSIVQTVLAANAMSGNSGNKELNAQTLTTLISSISSSRTMSANNVSTLGSNVSALSHLGSAWQGQSGQNNIEGVNAGFTSASKGGDNSLLYMIMQQRGQGGATGVMSARVQAEKGLSDTNNIRAVRNGAIGNMARSGASGQAMASMYLQEHFNLGASAATKFSKGLADGTLSDKELSKIAKESDKKGKSAAASGTGAYNKSDLKVLNMQTANIEKSESKAAASLKELTKLVGALQGTVKGMIAANVVSSVVSQGISYLGGGASKSVISGAGGAGGSGGFFSKLFSGGKGAAAAEATEDVGKTGITGKIIRAAKSGGSKLSSGFNYLFSGTKTGAAVSKAGEAAKSAGSFVKGKGSTLLSLFGDAGDAAKGAAEAGSGWKGIGGSIKAVANSGLGKAASKIATPLAIASSAFDIFSSKDKFKAVGRAGGGWAGAAAGGSAGAAIGTAILPGVGTAIGGVLGSIGGAIGGTKFGNWAGGKIEQGWDWTKKTAGNVWNGITSWFGGDDKSSSKSKLKTTQANLTEKNQETMLDKWDKIMTQWAKNIKDTDSTNSKSSSKSSSSSSSKSGHAFGGLVTRRTEIAEGNRPEMVVPLDPAKQSYTKNALSQITEMTGIRATDDKPSVVKNQGAFSPNITINHTGSGNNDDDALVHRLNQALTNATNDYRFNLQRQ